MPIQNNFCNVCHDQKNVEAKFKAGCGHLIRVCVECQKELKSIRHQPCYKCNSEITPDEDARLQREYEDSLMSSLYDEFYDDGGYDDFVVD